MVVQVNRAYCLKVDGEKSSGRPFAESRCVNLEDTQKDIFCKACGKAITTKDQVIEVNSSFRHTFFNPAGIVFELGCYKRAPGCRFAGPPSPDFSWFKGYLWSFALCSGCQTHLGWCFDSGASSFWGLILDKLKE
ncbi:MAG: hypothetical protein ACI8ZB_004443 [Desulforhopalus sp.]|jgi:hypothetical protein